MANDPWAQWVRATNPPAVPRLIAVAERLLDMAGVEGGSVLVDLGCGNGLVGVVAAKRGASVYFTDVSVQLLNDCRRRVEALSSAVPHYFIQVTADNLSPLADECADAVTARSVLIYLNAHDHVLTESYRVLRPGGRLALFEPLNAFWGEPRIGEFYGYDVASVAALAGRVRATWRSPIQRLFEVDPRSLGRAAQQAGFGDVMFTIEASLSGEPTFPRDWSRALAYVPNPLATSLGEAVKAALSAEEATRFSAAFDRRWSPIVATGGRPLST